MLSDEVEKLPFSINSILDDLTVIGLSVRMLETHYQHHADEEAKRYFQNIVNHYDNIVKTITINNPSVKKN